MLNKNLLNYISNVFCDNETLETARTHELRSFDAITAHTAIVPTRYIFLSLESRENKDNRAIFELFLAVCEELEDISFQRFCDNPLYLVAALNRFFKYGQASSSSLG